MQRGRDGLYADRRSLILSTPRQLENSPSPVVTLQNPLDMEKLEVAILDRDKQMMRLQDDLCKLRDGIVGLPEAQLDNTRLREHQSLLDANILNLTGKINSLNKLMDDMQEENDELRRRLQLDPSDEVDVSEIRSARGEERKQLQSLNESYKQEIERLNSNRQALTQKLLSSSGNPSSADNETNLHQHALEMWALETENSMLKKQNALFFQQFPRKIVVESVVSQTDPPLDDEHSNLLMTFPSIHLPDATVKQKDPHSLVLQTKPASFDAAIQVSEFLTLENEPLVLPEICEVFGIDDNFVTCILELAPVYATLAGASRTVGAESEVNRTYLTGIMLRLHMILQQQSMKGKCFQRFVQDLEEVTIERDLLKFQLEQSNELFRSSGVGHGVASAALAPSNTAESFDSGMIELQRQIISYRVNASVFERKLSINETRLELQRHELQTLQRELSFSVAESYRVLQMLFQSNQSLQPFVVHPQSLSSSLVPTASSISDPNFETLQFQLISQHQTFKDSLVWQEKLSCLFVENMKVHLQLDDAIHSLSQSPASSAPPRPTLHSKQVARLIGELEFTEDALLNANKAILELQNRVLTLTHEHSLLPTAENFKLMTSRCEASEVELEELKPKLARHKHLEAIAAEQLQFFDAKVFEAEMIE